MQGKQEKKQEPQDKQPQKRQEMLSKPEQKKPEPLQQSLEKWMILSDELVSDI